jgi:hypothetical protein
MMIDRQKEGSQNLLHCERLCTRNQSVITQCGNTELPFSRLDGQTDGQRGFRRSFPVSEPHRVFIYTCWLIGTLCTTRISHFSIGIWHRVGRSFITQTSWNVTGTPSRCREHVTPDNKLATQRHNLFSTPTFVFPYDRVSTVGTACCNNTLGSEK